MSITYDRTELAVLGATNARGCMQVFPSARGKQQKIAVGCRDGRVTCFSLKKGSATNVFSSKSSKPVTAMALGGPAGGPKDRLFVAQGHVIRGLKKKGKEFFNFQTALTEDILQMFVENPNIYTACEYTINRFEESVDSDFYMAPDVIGAMCGLPGAGALPGAAKGSDAKARKGAPVPLALGCADRYLRVVRGSHQVAQAKLPDIISTVEERSAGPGGVTQIMYGLRSGSAGLVRVAADGKVSPGWAIRDRRRGLVTCLRNVDITGDGVEEVVVGHDDGYLEVYSVDGQSREPEVRSSEQMANEAITNISSGNIVTLNNDIVFSSYSGRIVALVNAAKGGDAKVSRPRARRRGKKRAGGRSASPAAGRRGSSGAQGEDDNTPPEIRAKESEIEQIEKAILAKKMEFQSLSASRVAIEKQFNPKCTLNLNASEGVYELVLHVELPIERVVLHSEVPVLLVDGDSNEAIVSESPAPRAGGEVKGAGAPAAEAPGGEGVLATYTCTKRDANRLCMRFRTIEGQFGSLNLYVIPRASPKTCQRVQLAIKPLSLHEKLDSNEVKRLQESRVVNTLTIRGQFALTQVHGWVSAVLPGVPTRLAETQATMGFRSCVVGSTLWADYASGRGTFISDSVTTLSILKEVITREATKRQVRVDVKVDVKPGSIPQTLAQLRPQLDSNFALARRERLLAGLQEIKSHEEDVSFMTEEYLDILSKAADIKQAVKQSPKQLEFLKGIVVDLFVDAHKLLFGTAPKDTSLVAKTLTDNYSFDRLLESFARVTKGSR